uniref:ATP-NAD kinase family protein n=1 Tax=Shewanella putrefaciens TaxID=24 RepID=UPI0035686327
MIRFRLGLVINPLAGLGGSVGLKGSDGVAQEALALGAEPKAALRMMQALEVIRDYADDIEVITASGIMGEDAAKTLGFTTRVVYQTPDKTQALDTQAVVRALLDEPLDLLLFAGGDGTARNIFDALGEEKVAVLGIPGGCKIHSAVYAINPKTAGDLVVQYLQGKVKDLK